MKRALSSEEEAEWSEGESAWAGRLDSTRNTGGSFEPSMVAKSSHKSVMRKEVRNEVYPHDMNASEQSSESSDLQSIGDPEASDGEGGTSDDHLSNTLNTHNEISAQIHSNDEECEWSEGESAWATVGKFVWTPKIVSNTSRPIRSVVAAVQRYHTQLLRLCSLLLSE